MNLVVKPRKLTGKITVPSSKSIGHRELICAALAPGVSTVRNVTVSDDITATCRILQQLGADVHQDLDEQTGRATYHIRGGLHRQGKQVQADCGESGSTLRFLIPVGLISGNTVTYTGHGRLAQRPLKPYYDLFDQRDIHYEPVGGGLPLQIDGWLTPGRYAMPGNVSSQFFSGLLMALPLVKGDSLLCSTTKLESESYIELTTDCLQRHGIETIKKDERTFVIPGQQQFQAGDYVTEGDYSQAAFWLAAGILGDTVTCDGLSCQSRQGDKVILSLIRRMGGHIDLEPDVTAHSSTLKGLVIDVEDCPDLVPILTVLAALSHGTTHITNAARVRLKECDRLHAMAEELNKLGGQVIEEPDGLIINGVRRLHGGRVSGWNDHRVAMALAIVSQRCDRPVIIEGAECVRKSYPGFWKDFKTLGGMYTQEGMQS